MSISVKILADSIGPTGKRVTTRQWRYPRSIHSEIMTHKMFSKNSASSRAIPTEKLIQMVLDDPFIPKYIGKNQKGMQAGDELSDEQKELAVINWKLARDTCVFHAREMMRLGVHKQVVNRLIEPWMWITIIISATENENLWGLRCHEAAEPHFQELAYMDRDAVNASVPRVLQAGEWHLPLIDFDDEVDKSLSPEDLVKVSVGRCARVSYLTHDGRRDPKEDIALHDRLVVQRPLHASPAEHVCQAMDWPDWWEPTISDPDSFLEHLKGLSVPVLESKYDVLCNRKDLDGVDEDSAPELQQLVYEKRTLRDLFRDLQSGNFYGFRQYRKMLQHENIGRRLP